MNLVSLKNTQKFNIKIRQGFNTNLSQRKKLKIKKQMNLY